jgi:hypothetical protein
VLSVGADVALLIAEDQAVVVFVHGCLFIVSSIG